MSYRGLVKSNVRKAIALIKDLAEEFTLIQSNPTEYDFSTLEAGVTNPEKTTIKGVVLSTVRRLKSQASQTRVMTVKLLLVSDDVDDLTDYDSIVVRGLTYTISDYDDNGYTIEVDGVREGS